jgi:hypothetical protein
MAHVVANGPTRAVVRRKGCSYILYNYTGGFSRYLDGPDNRLQYDIAGRRTCEERLAVYTRAGDDWTPLPVDRRCTPRLDGTSDRQELPEGTPFALDPARPPGPAVTVLRRRAGQKAVSPAQTSRITFCASSQDGWNERPHSIV